MRVVPGGGGAVVVVMTATTAICCLLIAFPWMTAAKRPSLTSSKASSYRLQAQTATSLASMGMESSSRAMTGLPFVDFDVVEKYLENITSYLERKKRMVQSVPQETDLKNELVFNEVYDRTSRPVRNDRTVVLVKAGISLYHVLDIDEKLQLFSGVISIRLSWFDEYLRWEPSKWNNISSILLPSWNVWLPDVTVLNNVDLQHQHADTNVIVSNNGFVLWMFPAIVRTHCYLDLSWFPFDEQNCDLIMSPLSYDDRQLNFTMSPGHNASYYDEQGQEWTVASISAKRVAATQPLSHNKITRLIFRILLRRKVLFYLYTCVFPCFLIYFVSLLGFCVPITGQGGKIELPLTSLLSIVVLMMTLADTLAAADTVPLICKIYAWTMVQCCSSLVLNATVLIISRQRSYKPIPDLLLFLTHPNEFIVKRVRELTDATTSSALMSPTATAKKWKYQKRHPTKQMLVELTHQTSSSSTSSAADPSSSSATMSPVLVAKRHNNNNNAISNSTNSCPTAIIGVCNGNLTVTDCSATECDDCAMTAFNNSATTTTKQPCGSDGDGDGGKSWRGRRNLTGFINERHTTNERRRYNNNNNNNNNNRNNRNNNNNNTLNDSFLDDFNSECQPCSQWLRIANRINNLFFFVFILLTIVGYAMCLPSVY